MVRVGEAEEVPDFPGKEPYKLRLRKWRITRRLASYSTDWFLLLTNTPLFRLVLDCSVPSVEACNTGLVPGTVHPRIISQWVRGRRPT